MCLNLSGGLFPSCFLTKTLYTPPLTSYVKHAPPISFLLICSTEQYLVRIVDHKSSFREHQIICLIKLFRVLTQVVLIFLQKCIHYIVYGETGVSATQ
jgi:hypothetical protein